MKLYRSSAFAVLLLIQLIAGCSEQPATAEDASNETTAIGEEPGAQEESNPTSIGLDAGGPDSNAEDAGKTASGALSREQGPGSMPEKFSGIHEVLMDATSEKEPGNMAYNNHPEPIIALRWFARYGDEEKVRVFALHALGLYPTPENTTVLSEVAMNPKEPVAVRAGALRGLGRYDLEQEGLSAVKKFIFSAATGEDLVLAAAATDAMHGMPTARPLLLELSSSPKTPPSVKAAAERALGPQVE
jgi:hypothetical protein